jgi:hypothetical protein
VVTGRLTVEAALRRELRGRPTPWPALACSALELARRLDDPATPPAAAAALAKSLHDALDRLQVIAPARVGPDRLDDLRGRRERRNVS